MRRSIRLGISKEEKVAGKVITLLSDLTLDLEAMQYNKEVDQLDRGVYHDTR